MYELAIEITQDDLDTGEPCDYYNCAEARALKRYFGKGYPLQVGYQYVTVWDNRTVGTYWRLLHTEDSEQLMLNYDAPQGRYLVEPTTIHFFISPHS